MRLSEFRRNPSIGAPDGDFSLKCGPIMLVSGSWIGLLNLRREDS